MDIQEMTATLRRQRDNLDLAIQKLEDITGPQLVRANGSKRGRKTMSTAERREVSQRMRRYWAKRRKQRA